MDCVQALHARCTQYKNLSIATNMSLVTERFQ